jgi:hypothetical protein
MNYLQLKLAQMRIRGLGFNIDCYIYFSKTINPRLKSDAADAAKRLSSYKRFEMSLSRKKIHFCAPQKFPVCVNVTPPVV